MLPSILKMVAVVVSHIEFSVGIYNGKHGLEGQYMSS